MIHFKKLLAVCVCAAGFVLAQAQPFKKEIDAFKKQDSIAFPKKGSILFVGSSSFRLWDNFKDYFKGYPTLNRGFGGSTLSDAIRYANDIILPYDAKQIIIYSGENDLASSDTVTAAVVLKRFDSLFTIIRKKYKKVPVVFVSIKPSPSRARIFNEVQKANALIKDYLSKQQYATFVDVFNPMLMNGRPMGELFKKDSLHMNEKGYTIWEKEITPVLVK